MDIAFINVYCLLNCVGTDCKSAYRCEDISVPSGLQTVPTQIGNQK